MVRHTLPCLPMSSPQPSSPSPAQPAAAPVTYAPPGKEPVGTPGEVWPKPDPTTLRVMTWNLADMLGEPARIHRVIRSAGADVVCLQETNRWGLSRNLVANLARRSGMYYVVGGRRSAGLALLVSLRTQLEQAEAIPLSKAPQSWSLDPNKLVPRPRGLARARVGLPGTQKVSVVSCHLPLLPSEREKHWDHLRIWPDGTPTQVIAGDFNDTPGDPTWTAMSRDTRDPDPGGYPTYPADNAHRRLDAVLVEPEIPVVRYGWPSGATEEDVYKGTDHRPICADIALPARSA